MHLRHVYAAVAIVCLLAIEPRFTLGANPPRERLDWPQFRGPGGGGIAESAKPPIRFGPNTNLLWRVGAPAGHSSPIVVGDRIFCNAAEDHLLMTCAFDRKTGAKLWQAEIKVEHLEKRHGANSAVPCTPASDGTRVVSYLPSFGLVAHDLEGRELWRKPMPLPNTYRDQGSGASPIFAGGLVIVEVTLEKEVQLLALRAADGTEAWKAVLPPQMGWSTPVVWTDANGPCVGLAVENRFLAFNLADGKQLWWVGGLGQEACATPVIVGDRVLLSMAGRQGEPANMQIPPVFDEARKLWDKNADGLIVRSEIPDDVLLTDRHASDGKGNMGLKQMMGWFVREQSDKGFNEKQWEEMREMLRGFRDGDINRPNLTLVRLGGKGDVTKTHVQWEERRGIPEISSPLVYRDRIYLVRSGGLLCCRDLATGKQIYDERIGAPGGYYASPITADGQIYLASDRGTVTVVQAGDEFKVLGQSELGEPITATPAPVGEGLYVRSSKHLWAFGR